MCALFAFIGVIPQKTTVKAKPVASRRRWHSSTSHSLPWEPLQQPLLRLGSSQTG